MVKVVVPKLEKYKKRPSDYAPSKAPVFYNPIMEINRDLAVLALQVYQKNSDKKIIASEPLTGCGLRGIRLALEVKRIQKVIINDIKSDSTSIALFNTQLNNVSDLVQVRNEDANLFLNKHLYAILIRSLNSLNLPSIVCHVLIHHLSYLKLYHQFHLVVFVYMRTHLRNVSND